MTGLEPAEDARQGDRHGKDAGYGGGPVSPPAQPHHDGDRTSRRPGEVGAHRRLGGIEQARDAGGSQHRVNHRLVVRGQVAQVRVDVGVPEGAQVQDEVRRGWRAVQIAERDDGDVVDYGVYVRSCHLVAGPLPRLPPLTTARSGPLDLYLSAEGVRGFRTVDPPGGVKLARSCSHLGSLG